jgi:hypothetical protein
MLGLASPTGYLSITREAITGAAKIGESTLDGTPVTDYRVVVDLARLATVPGLSPEELTTINAALAVMQREGFTGNTTDVSVDEHGYVVHTKSVNNFADGGSVVSDDTFSLFGCAGAVQLPGRPVSIPSCTSLNDATTTTAPAGSSGSSTTLPSAPLIGQAAPTNGGVATPITGPSHSITITTGPTVTGTTIAPGPTPTTASGSTVTTGP